MLRLFHLLAGTTVTAMLMQDARKEGEGSSGVSVDDREVERVQRVLHQHANETVSFVCWWRRELGFWNRSCDVRVGS